MDFTRPDPRYDHENCLYYTGWNQGGLVSIELTNPQYNPCMSRNAVVKGQVNSNQGALKVSVEAKAQPDGPMAAVNVQGGGHHVNLDTVTRLGSAIDADGTQITATANSVQIDGQGHLRRPAGDVAVQVTDKGDNQGYFSVTCIEGCSSLGRAALERRRQAGGGGPGELAHPRAAFDGPRLRTSRGLFSPRRASRTLQRDAARHCAQSPQERTLMKRIFAAVAAALAIVPAFAEFPDRPITIVVPFAAGGPSDKVARDFAEALRKPLSQTVIIENVGGAGGTIGAARVAKATSDGYTLLLHNIGMSTSLALYRSMLTTRCRTSNTWASSTRCR
jgi:hypothetical protein